jgi:hypothetical protein
MIEPQPSNESEISTSPGSEEYFAMKIALCMSSDAIEGIPAILAGIPTLMNEAYITSMYAGNKINSLASLLKSKGYNTSFFHGGSNGTMGFEAFTKIAGFDTYYGRDQYNNENDYDGKWGIWDEAFLQNYAKQLNTIPQPFLSSIFTLSSHHPYKVPEKYKGKFKKGNLKIQESNIYSVTDYLNPFIDNIEKNISNDNLYSYIYVDEIDEEGYLSYNRVKYLLTPNQMYDFNNSVVAFYNLNDNQLLDYLNSIKVDYIFIRRSKRLANLLKINIPEDGVVYKKNNIKCKQIQDVFLKIG